MFIKNKYCSIALTGILSMALMGCLAGATSTETKVKVDAAYNECVEYAKIKEAAHSMAEHARFLGESEDSEIITTAKEYYEEAQEKHKEAYAAYTELNAQYQEEKAAEEAAKKAEEAKKGKYLGKFKITAYTPSPSENAGYSTTADGTSLYGNEWTIVAVDTNYWKYGTKFRIDGVDTIVTARDCGGAIKGSNRFDLLVPCGYANSWGVQYRDVYLVE